MSVAQDAPADAQHEGAMSAEQRREGPLVALGREAGKQYRVRQASRVVDGLTKEASNGFELDGRHGGPPWPMFASSSYYLEARRCCQLFPLPLNLASASGG